VYVLVNEYAIAAAATKLPLVVAVAELVAVTFVESRSGVDPVNVRPSARVAPDVDTPEAAVNTVLLFTEFAPDGAATNSAETVTVSVVSADVLATETGTEIVTGWFVVPPTTVGVPTVAGASVALAGATEDSKPKPKAATATSAMRLKVVFVDICFLSISRSREFPPVGFG